MRNLASRAVLLVSLWMGLFGLSLAAGKPNVVPVGASLVALASKYEAEVRKSFKEELGHDPTSNQELLEWLDRQTSIAQQLSDHAKDALVQRYGATLGQLLIQSFGGKWVRADTSQGPSDGVELPNGKVAFVFNRAARRIYEGDKIGFLAYFEYVDAMINHKPLPAGIGVKHSG